MHRAMRFAEHHRLLTQRQHAPRTQTHVRKNRVKIPRHIPRLHAVERTEVRQALESFPRGCRIAQATPAIPPRNRNAGSAARPRRRKLHRAPWRASKVHAIGDLPAPALFQRRARNRQSPGAPIAPRVRAARFRFRFRFHEQASTGIAQHFRHAMRIHVHQRRNPRALALRSCEHERMRNQSGPPPDYVRALRTQRSREMIGPGVRRENPRAALAPQVRPCVQVFRADRGDVTTRWITAAMPTPRKCGAKVRSYLDGHNPSQGCSGFNSVHAARTFLLGKRGR